MMKHNPVGWFEIYVQDLDRAKKFYESVFQLKLEKLESPEIELWGFPMDMGSSGASGALVKMDGVPSGGNSTLVYFHCEDCAAEESRFKKFGGGIHKNKMSIGQVRLYLPGSRHRRKHGGFAFNAINNGVRCNRQWQPQGLPLHY